MALRWRIRHKLLLGLSMVVGVIALLLVGTLQGLAAFTNTIKTSDTKTAQLNFAEKLVRAVNALSNTDAQPTIDDEEARFRKHLENVIEALAEYETYSQDPAIRQLDALHGDHEAHLVMDLKETLPLLEGALTAARAPRVIREGEGSSLVQFPAVQSVLKKLTQQSSELRHNVTEDLFDRFAAARKEHRRSLTLVLATSVIGVLLMAGLLRFFYNWIFHPIRDLQAGVARVAHGDFSQPIILNSQDELQQLAEAFNDMTGKLSATYDELSKQVSERGQQLVRSERLASVGYLAAGVAHEINNPLASIAFCAEGLERRLGDLLRRFPREHETIQKYLKMIQQEAFRCKSITQGLLEFSRVGEGQRQPTDLAELIQSTLDMVQHHPQAQDKQITFRPVASPVALANPQEIKQVVLNIVINALESMDAGGSLSIGLAARGSSAEISVTDTGCGMEQELLDKIFEPFFTANRTGKGTGLGLSISQRIITQHGGEIEASSQGPGHGSTFRVRLPLAHAGVAGLANSRKEIAHGHATAA